MVGVVEVKWRVAAAAADDVVVAVQVQRSQEDDTDKTVEDYRMPTLLLLMRLNVVDVGADVADYDDDDDRHNDDDDDGAVDDVKASDSTTKNQESEATIAEGFHWCCCFVS